MVATSVRAANAMAFAAGVMLLGAVPNVVGPAVGVCGEDPQAATSISTPAANAMALAPRTDVASIAHFLSPSIVLQGFAICAD